MMNNTTKLELAPSSWHLTMSMPQWVAWVTLCVIVALLAIFGNSLVLAAFVKAKHLRHQLNHLVVSLSVADILVGSISIPMWISVIPRPWNNSHITSGATFLKIDTWLDLLAAITSILHLMAISVERFFAARCQWEVRKSTSRHHHVPLCVVWGASTSIASLTLIEHSLVRSVWFYIIAGFYFVPLTVTCAAYIAVWTIYKRRITVRHRNPNQFTLMAQTKSSLKLVRTLFIVVLLFVFAWVPFFAVRFIIYSCGSYCISWKVFYFVKCLHYSNSAVNPIVYGLRIPGFRRTCASLLRLRKSNSVDLNIETAVKNKMSNLTLQKATEPLQKQNAKGNQWKIELSIFSTGKGCSENNFL